MPIGTIRERVLYGLSKNRTLHRYTRWRIAIAVVFTLGIAALPLTGTLRFDLWGGRHMWLGEVTDLTTVAKRFAFPFLAVNIAIVLASRFIGRYLCGFVCPVGTLSRLAEWLRWHDRTPRQRLVGTGTLFVFCLALAVITFSFWVDWRVFREGSTTAIALSTAFLVGTTGVLFGSAKLLGLRFCHSYCPSGVYFAVLGPETTNGVEFAHPETCTECGACERVCPMDLKPKVMAGGAPREGAGFYPEELSNFALCIRCGDCVKACEATSDDHDGPLPLRMGFLPPEARQSLPDEEEHGLAATAGSPSDAASASPEPAVRPAREDV